MNGRTDEETIFRKALLISDPAERATYLEQACGEDTDLRSRVVKLLVVDDSHWTGFDNLADFVDEQAEVYSNEPVWPTVENYTIQEEIGQGGMAVVYLAEQSEPFPRTVAIKVQRTNQLGSDSFRRFKAEQRILAKLNHVNIATIYTAGATDSGNPYVVMEWVNGLPLISFCNENQLGITDRLKLFKAICDGMEYAHHSGVIHRDLKPANVLVTAAVQGPVPKIIDFGIAKTFDAVENDSGITRESQIMGTLQYMSPEQATGNNRLVNFSSDIFSLGVILHELLIDEIPLASTFKTPCTLENMLKGIREVVPKPVSVTFAGLSDPERVARNHGTTVTALKNELTSELDFILSRMLAKQIGDRYSNIQTLKEDIDHYLAGRPVPKIQVQVQPTRYRQRGVGAACCLILFLCAVVSAIYTGMQESESPTGNGSLASVAPAKTERQNAVSSQVKRELPTLSNGSEGSTNLMNVDSRHDNNKTEPNENDALKIDSPVPVAESGAVISGSTAPVISPRSAESMGMKFKAIPAGTFTMGRGVGAHQVTLTQPFKMGVHEVTQAQYQQLMGENPSSFSGLDHPVDGVTWNDAFLFCLKLSALPEEQAAGNVYRLPTEAEWEYCCRAGNALILGETPPGLADQAWYEGNADDKTHPVGMKKANDFGLYDMYGNVWEWVQDHYGAFPNGPITDPTGPESGEYRVTRGGGWNAYAGLCSPTHRGRFPPTKIRNLYGFRVVLTSEPDVLPETLE